MKIWCSCSLLFVNLSSRVSLVYVGERKVSAFEVFLEMLLYLAVRDYRELNVN